jgi:cobalt-zinc-cadmium efflux system protein
VPPSHDEGVLDAGSHGHDNSAGAHGGKAEPERPQAGHSHAGHNHGGHGHAPASFGRAFAIGVILNLAFVIGEVVFGLSSHSLALVSDAGHNLSDVLGLVVAWGAMRAAKSLPTRRLTYGRRRMTILAALANAAMLLLVTGAVTWEAVRRLQHPEPVVASTIMWVAAVGILVNGITALMFFSGRSHDVNVRGAFLHMASDALVALGVVVAGFAIRATGRLWIDPLVSILIGVVITLGTWGLLRESLNLAMDAVPAHIDPEAVEGYLASVTGVEAVHDLHIWAMSTTESALTVHLVTRDPLLDDARLRRVCDALRDRFRIDHSTIQLEHGDVAHPCRQEPAASV